MGLDANGTRALLWAHRLGVDFSRTATLGRQGLHLSRGELAGALRAFGLDAGAGGVDALFTAAGGYADALLARLGAGEVHSWDVTTSEGATHAWDLNRPVPDEARERYTAVVDAGTLEHVFDFPTAIRSCMEMVAVGGHYLAVTPANNFMGHGFYQFSPEVFSAVFTPENGFVLVRLAAFEDRRGATWHAVQDPRRVMARVELTNRVPVYLVVVARRVARTPIFARAPQQSDYDPARPGAAAPAGGTRAWFAPFTRFIPPGLKPALRRAYLRRYRGFDPRYFTPFDPARDEAPTASPPAPPDRTGHRA